VMVYCYQLATLIQQPAKSDTTADQHELKALRERAMALLTTLAVADDIKLVDWLQQRLGLLEHRDTAMLHRLLHDIEKNITK
ncbi:tRNA/rRNA methyltransferase, partial [Escherichia coli]|nr:tRNA/rRNA methyltransferase [Escherichia coli]